MQEQEYLDTLNELHAKAWPVGQPREPEYPLGKRPLTAYLRHWADTTPDKAAVHFYGHELSYAEHEDLSNRFAALLLDQGVQVGDEVAVFMPNCMWRFTAF